MLDYEQIVIRLYMIANCTSSTQTSEAIEKLIEEIKLEHGLE